MGVKGSGCVSVFDLGVDLFLYPNLVAAILILIKSGSGSSKK